MPDLPTLLEGDLGQSQCDDLFADLASCADLANVQVRLRASDTGDAEMPVNRRTSLSEAQQLLRQGAVSMVQIRYRYQDANWCDTILAGPSGVRLVRMQQTP